MHHLLFCMRIRFYASPVYGKAALVIFFLSLFSSSFAQKTDKVYLKNGDVLTGQIKRLSLAILIFKMDGPGTIDIKWEEVKGIKSDKVFEINLRGGEVLIARLDSTFSSIYHVQLDDMIEIFPINEKFLQRLIGDVNLGFNYTKASQIIQFNLGSSITYRIPKVELGISLNSVMTNRSGDSVLTKKQDVTAYALKYFTSRFFLVTQLGWQQNTELGISNRFLLNGAAGSALFVNNHNRMLAGGGFSLNAEQAIETSEYMGYVDALLFIQYKRFYYSPPRMSLNAGLLIYQGLSDWGRIRAEFNFSSRIEIVKDFSIGLSFYDNYDSKPPEGALSKNDFGISFSLGFEFGK
jgi:hypothetical protein